MRECTEVENKTVRKLTIFDDEAKSPEVVIEFSDGSVFSAAFTSITSVQATLTVDEGGEPRVLADYQS